jgi:hypothetical protein
MQACAGQEATVEAKQQRLKKQSATVIKSK